MRTCYGYIIFYNIYVVKPGGIVTFHSDSVIHFFVMIKLKLKTHKSKVLFSLAP